MEENTLTPAVQLEANPAPRKRGFQPGHQRFGGRKKGSPIKRTAQAQEIAEKMGFHPVEFLSRVAQQGTMLNPDGTEEVCDKAMRLDAAKAVSQYLVPKLAATQVTGKDDGPIETTTFDMNKLLSDPDAVEAAQKLALKLAETDAARPTEPADVATDQPTE